MAKKVVAGVLWAFGGFMGVAILTTVGEAAAGSIAAALIAFAAAPIAGGTYVFARARADDRARDVAALDAWDAELLRLSAALGSHLTVSDVIEATGLPADRAEAALDRAAARGVAEARVAEDGTLVYRFARRLGVAEKAAAEGPLDG